MNGAHLHLAVNHGPVFGIAFGLLLQIWGMLRKSRDLRLGALGLFLFSALLAVAAWKTGGGASQVVRGLPGIERVFIRQHAEAGEQAMIAAIVTGVLSLVAWYLPLWSLKWGKAASFLLLISAFVTAGWMGWTANLGGQVRHTEIRSEAPAVTAPADSLPSAQPPTTSP